MKNCSKRASLQGPKKVGKGTVEEKTQIKAKLKCFLGETPTKRWDSGPKTTSLLPFSIVISRIKELNDVTTWQNFKFEANNG